MQQIAKPAPKNSLYILSGKTNRTNKIKNALGLQALLFIERYVDIDAPDTIIQKHPFDFSSKCPNDRLKKSIINFKPLDRIDLFGSLSKYLLNNLSHEGIFIGRIECMTPPKEYYFSNGSFSLFRSLKPENKKNRNQNLILPSKKISYKRILKKKIEVLGKLCYLGFEIISESEIGPYLYFVSKKIAQPSQNPKPSGFPIIKLNRIGKGGKTITIYKVRTMYPYSEYLQAYTYKNNHIEPGGKFCNDHRISRIGNFMRRYWIDELPMIINLIKGDVKLIGVRPLSQQYFTLYPKELQELRTKYKPGLIPPYYADLPTSFEEILDSEHRYLMAFRNKPFQTDLKYLAKALFNIIVKFKRSK